MQKLGPQVGIRELRKAHGLTITALAARIEPIYGKSVDPDHISNVELGHKRASDPLLTAWAKALGVLPLDVRQPDAIADLLKDVA